MAARLFSYEEILKKLAPYRCRRVMKLPPGFELWETGWTEPFTLRPEPPNQYSEEQLRRALVFIAETMPSDWNGNGG